MANDAFTIKYLAQKLNKMLSGGKINKINQPNSTDIIMLVYANGISKKLILSSNANLCRVCFTDISKENPADAPSFCMLLRKHLSGGTITKISAIENERIIKIEIENKNDFLENEIKVLYAEIMGKYSNVILTVNDKIMGALRQANLEEASTRPILSGIKYVLPHSQDKLNPKDVDNSFTESLSESELATKIFNNIKGLSFQTANELSYRYFNNYYDTSNFSDVINEFYKEKEKPVVLSVNGKLTDILPFKYFSMQGEYTAFDDICSAWQYFYDNKDNQKSFLDKKQSIISTLTSTFKKLNKKKQIIADKRSDCDNMEQNRIKGELLTTYCYKLQNGIKQCQLENYYNDNKLLTITLNENLTISKNAQNYYTKYNKQKRTLEAIAIQEKEALEENNYLESVLAEIESCSNQTELNFIAEELIKVGIMKKTQKRNNNKKQTSEKFLEYDIDGYTFLVGKNNIQNDELVKSSKGNDIWLHTKTYHSAHGLFLYKGTEIPLEVIVKGAKIIAQKSSGKNSSKIDVDYTKARFVKKPNGSKPGFVTYTNFKTVTVSND